VYRAACRDQHHSKIIEGWGFRPSTIAFVWIKYAGGNGLHGGNGYCTRADAEFVFYASKGKSLRLAADDQVVMSPIGEHSAKPEEVRRRIERLFAGPYLELYERRPVEGWVTWGNELSPEQMNGEAVP
jgi:N6-adenosine-specific RNA methylase IME4